MRAGRPRASAPAVPPCARPPLAGIPAAAAAAAAGRRLPPAMERDVGGHLRDGAEAHAIAVFAPNLVAAPASQPIWPWLTLAAALLLPLARPARRPQLTRRDRGWAGGGDQEIDLGRNEAGRGWRLDRAGRWQH